MDIRILIALRRRRQRRFWEIYNKNHIRLWPISGNIKQGKFTLYGVKDD